MNDTFNYTFSQNRNKLTDIKIMKHLHIPGFLIGLIFIYMLSFSTIFSQNYPVLSFSVKDQFDSLHTEKEYLGKISVVLGADRGGGSFNDSWINAIRTNLGNKFDEKEIKFLSPANVSSVPFFLKGFVKSKFPEKRNNWVLMDWKGYFADSYQFIDNTCNVVIFNKTGKFIYKTNGREIDNQKLATLCNKIVELLQAAQ